MRFLVDESTGPVVAAWLRAEGHDVFSVYEEARGMIDDTIIHKAEYPLKAGHFGVGPVR